jgi:hypothetical protein
MEFQFGSVVSIVMDEMYCGASTLQRVLLIAIHNRIASATRLRFAWKTGSHVFAKML